MLLLICQWWGELEVFLEELVFCLYEHLKWFASIKNIDKKWLFDLKNDPTEKVNLALLKPSKVSELEALLDNHNLEQKEPNMESVIATPILIDKHTGQKYAEGDEYTYWDN